MPSSAPDWRLVARARSGDRRLDAFARLVARYQQPLARYLWALGIRDLEPWLEQVFVAAYRDLPHARQYPSVRAWLYAIASRRVPAGLDQRALVLLGREGFSLAEVAHLLDRPPATVQAAFRRAKRRLARRAPAAAPSGPRAPRGRRPARAG